MKNLWKAAYLFSLISDDGSSFDKDSYLKTIHEKSVSDVNQLTFFTIELEAICGILHFRLSELMFKDAALIDKAKLRLDPGAELVCNKNPVLTMALAFELRKVLMPIQQKSFAKSIMYVPPDVPTYNEFQVFEFLNENWLDHRIEVDHQTYSNKGLFYSNNIYYGINTKSKDQIKFFVTEDTLSILEKDNIVKAWSFKAFTLNKSDEKALLKYKIKGIG